jgi:hypothetical protein
MVGHIMQLAAYLSASRHGIFYFRYPVPVDWRPVQKRSHIKVSLSTREPREARKLARILGLAGQSIFAQPNVRSMRYEDMRDHFSNLLQQFRERSASDGPARGAALDALRAAEGLSEDQAEDWAGRTHAEGADGLLRAFCAAIGIAPEPEGRARGLLLAELQKGYREYITRAVEHTEEFEKLPLEQVSAPRQWNSIREFRKHR